MVTITCIKLQSCAKLLYKYIGYHLINWNTRNNTWSIRKQALGYTIFLKRKQIEKVKGKGCAEGCYHQNFNHEIGSNLFLVPSCVHPGSYVINAMDYKYKLRSVIGREDYFTSNKLTWFDKQGCTTFYGHGWYHGHWLITPTWEELLVV